MALGLPAPSPFCVGTGSASPRSHTWGVSDEICAWGHRPREDWGREDRGRKDWAAKTGQDGVFAWLRRPSPLVWSLILSCLFLAAPAAAQSSEPISVERVPTDTGFEIIFTFEGGRTGVLEFVTINEPAQAPDEDGGTVTVERTVGQQFNLTDGEGSVRAVLNDDGTTTVTGTINGRTINRTLPRPIGELDAGADQGVTPPPIEANFDAGPDPVTRTVQRVEPRTSSETEMRVNASDASFFLGDAINDCENVRVAQGRVICTTIITTTTTNLVTQIVFVDRIVVTEISVADLERLLRLELPLDGLTPNQRAVAVNLNALAQRADFAGSPLEAVFTALAELPFAAYAAALDQLHPEPYDAWTENAHGQARAFHGAILERLTRARAQRAARRATSRSLKDSARAPQHEGWQAWGHASGATSDRERTRANIAYTTRGGGFQAGWDKVIGNDTLIGVSVSYHRTHIDVDTRASGDSDTAMVGVYGAWAWGDLTLDASAAVGYHWADVARRVAFADIAGSPSSSPDWAQVSGQLNASYRATFDAVTVKPFAGLSVTWMEGFSVTETGDGAVNLAVRRDADTQVDSILGLEISARLRDTAGNVVVSFAGFAWRRALTDPDRSIDARFLTAPADAAGFTARANEDRDRLDVKAGITTRLDNGITATLGWQGQFSKRSDRHAGHLQLSVPF